MRLRDQVCSSKDIPGGQLSDLDLQLVFWKKYHNSSIPFWLSWTASLCCCCWLQSSFSFSLSTFSSSFSCDLMWCSRRMAITRGLRWQSVYRRHESWRWASSLTLLRNVNFLLQLAWKVTAADIYVTQPSILTRSEFQCFKTRRNASSSGSYLQSTRSEVR